MFRPVLMLTVCAPLAALLPGNAAGAAEPGRPVRGILVRPERVTPEFLAGWKAKGATDVVVVLDETTKPRWERTAGVVAQAGMTLWPWIEVARNPQMASAHPDWMATPGGHHDDWRRRFPLAPRQRKARSSRRGPGFQSAMYRRSMLTASGCECS